MDINNTPDTMTSSSVVIEKLKLKNIENEFRYNGSGFSINNGKSYMSQELTIVKVYRFEGYSNPSDMEVIYLIKASDNTMGFFQDAYGTYAEDETLALANFIRLIPEAYSQEDALEFEL